MLLQQSQFQGETAMNRSVIAITRTKEQTEAIAFYLQQAGFSSEQVSFLLPDTHAATEFAHEHNTKAPEGAIAGVAGGGLLGGALGLLAGAGILALPGLGPLLVAGPLLAALSGAAAGAAVGGVGGALVGLGIPEFEARLYEGRLKGGNILLAVHVENRNEQTRAEEILRNGGATDVSLAARVEATSNQGANSSTLHS
jgi:hypothetical protein